MFVTRLLQLPLIMQKFGMVVVDIRWRRSDLGGFEVIITLYVHIEKKALTKECKDD